MKALLYAMSTLLLVVAYVMFFVPPIRWYYNVMGVIDVVMAAWFFYAAMFGERTT